MTLPIQLLFILLEELVLFTFSFSFFSELAFKGQFLCNLLCDSSWVLLWCYLSDLSAQRTFKVALDYIWHCYIVILCGCATSYPTESRTMFDIKAKVKSLSRVWLCDPTDCIGYRLLSVRGIFQARVLEEVAISLSRGSSRPRNWTQVSHIAGRCFTLWATSLTQVIV